MGEPLAPAPVAPKVERKPMPEINMKKGGTAEDVKVLLAHLQNCWTPRQMSEPVCVVEEPTEVPDNAFDDLRDITTRMAKAGTAPHTMPVTLGRSDGGIVGGGIE